MLITLTFLVAAKKLGLFLVSNIELLSRCAGDEQEHSQAREIFYTIDITFSL